MVIAQFLLALDEDSDVDFNAASPDDAIRCASIFLK